MSRPRDLDQIVESLEKLSEVEREKLLDELESLVKDQRRKGEEEGFEAADVDEAKIVARVRVEVLAELEAVVAERDCPCRKDLALSLQVWRLTT